MPQKLCYLWMFLSLFLHVMFVPSPEFEPAGDEYGRAGQAYKVAKKYNDALVSN